MHKLTNRRHRRFPLRPGVFAPLLVLSSLAGCSGVEREPQLDPDALPRAIARLGAAHAEIQSAMAEDRPQDADRSLHDVGKLLSSIQRSAELGELPAEARNAISAAVDKLYEAFGALHEPMHEEEFPEDFDFSSLDIQITSAIEELRQALPTAIAEKLKAMTPRVEPPAGAAGGAAEGESANMSGEHSPEAMTAPEDASRPDLGLPEDQTSPAMTPSPAGGASARRVRATLVAQATQPKRPICPTVMMFDDTSRAAAAETIERAAREFSDNTAGGRRWAQFVPTVHARLTRELRVERYGLQASRGGSWSEAGNFAPIGEAEAERLRRDIDRVMECAVAAGLHVAWLPHLDPGGGPVSEWRNKYDFDPTARIGGYSYQQLLLEPIAEAVLAHATSETGVDFALSGEMGRSLFAYAPQYLSILRDLKQRFDGLPNVRIGVCLNWSGNDGGADPASIDSGAVREFFAECDFVGYSCYTPVRVPASADDFRRSVAGFVADLDRLGASLPNQTPIVLAEVGVGGGVPAATGALTPQDAANEPWQGKGWGGVNAWADPAMRAFRRSYYRALCAFLDDPRCERPIDRAFLWSEGPWDPQGLVEERFRDETIAAEIAAHNAG